MKVLAYNLFYGEKKEQIEFINNNNFDIIFLSEASDNVIDNFDNYTGDYIKSHCGFTYLGIHKKYNIDILMIIKLTGCVVFHVKINDKEFILGSLHLYPYKENKKLRQEQINRIYDDLQYNNLLHLPIILGGDTNMTDNDNYIDSYDFIEFSDITYPNRLVITKNIKNDFKYDRFFIKNCSASDFKTIPNNCSDHLAISINIKY